MAQHLTELYPGRDVVGDRVNPEFLARMVDQVTSGLMADVGVVPRVFLRELIEVLDLCEENDDYVPSERYGFTPQRLTPDERKVLDGGGEDLEPVEDTW